MMISDEIKQQILDILFKFLEKEHLSVFLFGSFAEGTHKQISDIDIGIFYDFDLSLSQILKIKSELNEEVKTLRDIDIVNFSGKLDSKFKEIALKEVIVWHHGRESEVSLNSIQKH